MEKDNNKSKNGNLNPEESAQQKISLPFTVLKIK